MALFFFIDILKIYKCSKYVYQELNRCTSSHNCLDEQSYQLEIFYHKEYQSTLYISSILNDRCYKASFATLDSDIES